jgi:hypothetical protein
MDLVRCRAFSIMASCFKNFKTELAKHLEKDTEPDWKNEFFNQQQYRDEFRNYRLSKKAKEKTRKNKKNSAKNLHPHRFGSRGYLKKIPEWDRQDWELVARGVTPQTAKWELRASRYLLGRGASWNPNGSLRSSASEDHRDLTQKVAVLHDEAAQGRFISNREKDVLTRALGNNEHPGRTRGAGVVPWQIAFGEDDAYKRRKMTAAER